MKFLCSLIIITVALFHTAHHQPPGSLGYELVIKPFPSPVLFVGAAEEKQYREKLDKNEFPLWLKQGDYEVIANGSHESKSELWEYSWFSTIVFVLFGWTYMLGLLIRKTFRHITSR